MRRTKSLTLTRDEGDLEVTIYEVRPLDFLELHQKIQKEHLSIGEYERLLPLCVNISKEQLLQLYPSEMEEIIDAFKEVNRSFLAPWPTIKKTIEKVGLVDWLVDMIQKSGILEHMKTALSLDLQKVSVSLPTSDIKPPNSTDGGTTELH
jgi:hypothetical protein